MGIGIERGIRSLLGMPNDQISAKQSTEIAKTRLINLTTEFNYFTGELKKLDPALKNSNLNLDTTTNMKNDFEPIKNLQKARDVHLMYRVKNGPKLNTKQIFNNKKIRTILLEAQLAATKIVDLKYDISSSESSVPGRMYKRNHFDSRLEDCRVELDHLRQVLGKKPIKPLVDRMHIKGSGGE
jgi:hypothetical protein